MASIDKKDIRSLFDRADTTFLRGLSIIAIVVHHIYQFTLSKYGINYPPYVSLLLSSLGYMGVSVFFLLSGYGLTCSVQKNTPLSRSYLITHLAKLVEPFVFIWILDLIFFFTSARETFINLVTLSISNNDLWFLKEIFILYLLYLLPLYFFRPTAKKFYIGPIVLSILFAVVLYVITPNSYWWNSTLCFPLGIWCAAQRDKLDVIYRKHRGLLCVLLLAVFVISLYVSFYIIPLEVVRSISFAMLTVLLATYGKHQVKFLDICSAESLKIYIFHVFLLQFWPMMNCLFYILLIPVGTAVLIWLYNRLFLASR